MVGLLDAVAFLAVLVVPAPAISQCIPDCCIGDCDGSGDVTIYELETLVRVALDEGPVSACVNGVPPGVMVDITLIIMALNNGLEGCG